MIVGELAGFDDLEDLGKSKFKKLAKKLKGGMLFPKPLRRKRLGWKEDHQVWSPAPAPQTVLAPHVPAPQALAPQDVYWNQLTPLMAQAAAAAYTGMKAELQGLF